MFVLTYFVMDDNIQYDIFMFHSRTKKSFITKKKCRRVRENLTSSIAVSRQGQFPVFMKDESVN